MAKKRAGKPCVRFGRSKTTGRKVCRSYDPAKARKARTKSRGK